MRYIENVLGRKTFPSPLAAIAQVLSDSTRICLTSTGKYDDD